MSSRESYSGEPGEQFGVVVCSQSGESSKSTSPMGTDPKIQNVRGPSWISKYWGQVQSARSEIGDRSLNFIILVHAFHSTNPLTPRWGALAGYDRSWDIWPFDLSPKIEVGDRSDKSKKSHLGTGRQSP